MKILEETNELVLVEIEDKSNLPKQYKKTKYIHILRLITNSKFMEARFVTEDGEILTTLKWSIFNYNKSSTHSGKTWSYLNSVLDFLRSNRIFVSGYVPSYLIVKLAKKDIPVDNSILFATIDMGYKISLKSDKLITDNYVEENYNSKLVGALEKSFASSKQTTKEVTIYSDEIGK